MFGATADAAFELEWLLHLTSYNFNFYPFSFNGISKNTADTHMNNNKAELVPVLIF